MRSLTTFLAAGLAATLSSALDAPVYTFGSLRKGPEGDKPPSLSPANARLLLADRLGLSQSHSLKDADESTLRLLSEERDNQSPLFSNECEEKKLRILFVVEGVQKPKEFFAFDKKPLKPAFTIVNAPPPKSNLDLIDYFLQEDHRYRGAFEGGLVRVKTFSGTSQVRGGLSTDSRDTRHYLKFLNPKEAGFFSLPLMSVEMGKMATLTSFGRLGSPILAVQIPAADSSTDAFKSFMQDYLSSDTYDDVETTVVLMPYQNQKSTGSWGALESPKHSHAKRAAQQETPLTDSTPAVAESPSASKVSATATASASFTPPKNSSYIPKATIPFCYPKESTCNNVTASCSGHGKCYKKFVDKVSQDEEGAECWACACSPTILDRDGGIKTINWGGPACQKKDVSVPFFLFAGFSIAAVSIIAWGIGLMYSIGNEQLPSVLGAGVAPTSRK